MIRIHFEVHIPELDKRVIDVDCPHCELDTPVQLGEIRRQDITICRGCHANIHLEDHLGSVHRARAMLRRVLGQFGK